MNLSNSESYYVDIATSSSRSGTSMPLFESLDNLIRPYRKGKNINCLIAWSNLSRDSNHINITRTYPEYCAIAMVLRNLGAPLPKKLANSVAIVIFV